MRGNKIRAATTGAGGIFKFGLILG